MPRKLIPPEPWWADAANLMVKYDLSLRQAAQELGIELTIEEAEAIKDRKLFKEALEQAQLAYYTEIGSNPSLTKEAIVGQIYKLASRLAEDREDYKASDALLKLAKVKGWVGQEPDTLWQTFSALSHQDIQEVRRKLEEQIEQQQQPQPADGSKVEPQQVN